MAIMRRNHFMLTLGAAALAAACSQSTVASWDSGLSAQEKSIMPPAAPDATALTQYAQQGLLLSPFPVRVDALTTAQAEELGVGSYLVNSIGGCGDCHNGSGGFLSGGQKFPLPGLGADAAVYA